MSRRCLICANINPCPEHSGAAQETEFDRNCKAVSAIREHERVAKPDAQASEGAP